MWFDFKAYNVFCVENLKDLTIFRTKIYSMIITIALFLNDLDLFLPEIKTEFLKGNIYLNCYPFDTLFSIKYF